MGGGSRAFRYSHLPLDQYTSAITEYALKYGAIGEQRLSYAVRRAKGALETR